MDYLERTMDAHRSMIENLDLETIRRIADRLTLAYRNRKKVIILGNGGSAADSLHFAAELEGQLSSVDRGRKPLKALTPCNWSALTAVSNDFGFEESFARFVDANTDDGDIVIAISTSGNSPNILRALEVAKHHGGCTIGLTGGKGGKLKEMVDLCLCVPATSTSIVQEGHTVAYHRICALVVRELFGCEAV